MSVAAAPGVGIVLTNWNNWRDTIECLESLFRLDYGAFNVVVCDQGSTDGSIDRIRDWAAGSFMPEYHLHPRLTHLVSPPARKPIPMVVHSLESVDGASAPSVDAPLTVVRVSENIGSGAGNNVGLRFLYRQNRVKYAWILNNDTVVAPDSLTELVKCAESDSNIGAVGGQLMDYRDPDLVQTAGGGHLRRWKGYPTAVEKVQLVRHADGDSSADLDWVSGGHMLSPLSALRQVGPIDQDYFVYMEDIDHSLRIRDGGFRFGYAPKSLVWHKGGGTVRHRSLRHDYYTVRNSLFMARKRDPRTLAFVYLYTVYRCVLPKVVRGDWARLRVVIRAIRDYRHGMMGMADI